MASLIVDPGVVSSILALPLTFMEIDHEIFSSHSPPSSGSRRVVVSYKQKYCALSTGKLLSLSLPEIKWSC